MLKITKEKMIKHAQSIGPSTQRAACYQIAALCTKGKTIAEAVLCDHSTLHGALRAATLRVHAGCAKEKSASPNEFGKFIFEDGSEL